VKVLFAPDSYGGFLSAPEACRRFAEHAARFSFRTVLHPMSDGGEGLLDVLAFHRPFSVIREIVVSGPYGEPQNARAGLMNGVLVVESAEPLGLARVARREPMCASSAGLGQLLGTILDNGLFDGPILVGLGGTATMDAGLGTLLALGLVAWTDDGRPIGSATASDLANVQRLSGRTILERHVVDVLCDVGTPLAAAPRWFGPQKGLRPHQIEPLEGAFQRWGHALAAWRDARGFSPIPQDLPGGGAAGGVGFALAAGAGAHLVPGAAQVARFTGLDDDLSETSVLVVGEGRLDATSVQGKVAGEVIRRARGAGVDRVIALVGEATDPPPPPDGPDLVVAAGGPPDLGRFDDAIDRTLKECG
jgi:glycerate 2-kinase